MHVWLCMYACMHVCMYACIRLCSLISCSACFSFVWHTMPNACQVWSTGALQYMMVLYSHGSRHQHQQCIFKLTCVLFVTYSPRQKANWRFDHALKTCGCGFAAMLSKWIVHQSHTGKQTQGTADLLLDPSRTDNIHLKVCYEVGCACRVWL